MRHKTINPDIVGFKRPDFGFNDYLTFEEEQSSQQFWKKIGDCIKTKPEQERLLNYITFVSRKKYEALNIHGQSTGKSEPHSVRELLRQAEQSKQGVLPSSGGLKKKLSRFDRLSQSISHEMGQLTQSLIQQKSWFENV